MCLHLLLRDTLGSQFQDEEKNFPVVRLHWFSQISAGTQTDRRGWQEGFLPMLLKLLPSSDTTHEGCKEQKAIALQPLQPSWHLFAISQPWGWCSRHGFWSKEVHLGARWALTAEKPTTSAGAAARKDKLQLSVSTGADSLSWRDA